MRVQKYAWLLAGMVGILAFANISNGDSWDPGDNAGPGGTALTMTGAVQVHGPHTMDNSDIADWFQISLTAGNIYHFESTGIYDMHGSLYDNSAGTGTPAAADDDGGAAQNFHVAYIPTSTATYYLKVRTVPPGTAVNYSLNYYFEPPPVDSWDPGDDTGAGATDLLIDEAERTNGTHTLSATDTNDWFSFSLVAGNTYRFESTGASDTYGSLYSNSAGTSLITSDDQSGVADNFLIDYKPSVSADYYLKVRTPTSGFPASYTLKYIIIEDQWDPADDSGSGATLLNINTTLQMHGPHTLSATDTNDWFKLSLVAGNTYRFETTVALPNDQDTKGFLYSDSSGINPPVAVDDDSGEFDNFLIIYTPTVSADYYLRAIELNGYPAGYWLKYSKDSNGDEDGDGMADAWEIQYFTNTNELPNANWDSDFFSNLEEYIAGTDPTNPASFFAVTNWSAGSFILEWPSVAAREYKVLWAASLTNSFQQQGAMIDGPQNSYTDTVHNANASGFYKVGVQLK